MKNFNDLQKELKSKEPYLEYALRVIGLAMAAKDQKGWSRADLATKADIPYYDLLKITKGEWVPSIQTLYKLIQATGISDQVKEYVSKSGSNEGKWVWDTNDEMFRSDFFDTKEEAIEDARGQEDAGETIYVGQVVEPTSFTGVDVDGILERISEQVYEEVGEVAIDYLSYVKQEDFTALENSLNDVIRKWMKERGYEPNFFKVDNIEGVEL
ncbi:hypothetical protein HWC53_gp134 [Bacillus phage vB_BmeM-Goe8]|uniref:Uncharacterized protein n=1 Tax=Bacillus phage vB_BmeM-Goe8 TaxID=2593638 RepID=A0A516KN00_9CAUD|nr:hypothetical protein HWC53_gp134 [Bacillus phage vB_BmeM-Goe8]QDP42955.1 hypothetical protein Goe8_c01820 [Bacillus phage vB_BmeM-Goe8]